MRKNIWVAAFVAIAILLVYNVVTAFAESDDVPERKLQIIEGATYNVVDQAHFLKLDANDAYSEKVFDEYFKNIDYEKKYFTEKDFSFLNKYKRKLDDELRNDDIQFFDLVDSIYMSRLELTQGWYREILDQPFDFTKKEKVGIKTDKIPYEKDMTSLRKRWELLMKQRVLQRYADAVDNQEKNADSLKAKGEYKNTTELEKEARESTLKTFDQYYKRLNNMSLQDRFALFMNSYLEMVDPHTGYFPPEDKDRFDVAMSGSFFGIGAQLRQDDDKTVVERIIVGSPCYKQGSLKKGDIIRKVGQGADPAEDITGQFLDDVVSKIRGKDGTEVRLTVEHIDGQKEVIPIIRGKVDMEETYVKSAILDRGNQKLGYINLPEFYFDANDRNGRSCYKDMKNEILNLKKENINGLIVDLRNNGGGSLSDVVKIVGLFIKDGPVVRVLDREGRSDNLDDRDEEIYYDGPLTILVNEGSASASEIMAAALQDYNRATIIGNTTFGKGTVQQFIDLGRVVPRQTLDKYLRGLDDDQKALGAVKVTIQKFYRIDGGSTQRKGVTPDVKIPDMYEYIDRGERQMTSALPWDSISPSSFRVVNPKGWNNSQISKLNNFVKSSEYFSDILKIAKYLEEEDDRVYADLDYASYKQQKDKRDQIFKILDKYTEDSTTSKLVNVSNPSFRMAAVAKDTASKERNQNWLDAIAKDHYVDVAIRSFEK